MTLNELSLKHGTDKGFNPDTGIGHDYCPLYEKHLPKKINKFLEIGVWKGGGIRMFREWYKEEGMFYGLDRFIDGHGLIMPHELQAHGINCFDIDHDQMWALETIKEQFSVIVDDGSHHWDSQINIFRRFFVNNLESGGLYVIEDVFDDLYWGRNLIKNEKENIKGIMNKFKSEGTVESMMITKAESDIIYSMIDDVNIYNEIVFIKKK